MSAYLMFFSPGPSKPVEFELRTDLSWTCCAGISIVAKRVLQRLRPIGVREEITHLRVEMKAVSNLDRKPGSNDLATPLTGRGHGVWCQRCRKLRRRRSSGWLWLLKRLPVQSRGNSPGQNVLTPRGPDADLAGERG